jgi:hypothetical protein
LCCMGGLFLVCWCCSMKPNPHNNPHALQPDAAFLGYTGGGVGGDGPRGASRVVAGGRSIAKLPYAYRNTQGVCVCVCMCVELYVVQWGTVCGVCVAWPHFTSHTPTLRFPNSSCRAPYACTHTHTQPYIPSTHMRFSRTWEQPKFMVGYADRGVLLIHAVGPCGYADGTHNDLHRIHTLSYCYSSRDSILPKHRSSCPFPYACYIAPRHICKLAA